MLVVIGALAAHQAGSKDALSSNSLSPAFNKLNLLANELALSTIGPEKSSKHGASIPNYIKELNARTIYFRPIQPESGPPPNLIDVKYNLTTSSSTKIAPSFVVTG